MKLFKLWVHQKTFSDDELVLNPKDYPGIKVGDVVEIYHPEDEYSRLLLQVKPFTEDIQQKDTISLAQSIATNFHLRMYKEVHVNIVTPKDVACDLVELTYKDQYFSRADMWRLRKSLIGTCMHLSQKIRNAEMRAQVEELWSKGEKVKCGYITEDTRVTFRSSTAQVNIFIQMSSEMWEFDNYGDLYFEKAVDGFLVDLFSQWKELNCNHDVTITMFSRTYYDAKSIEEFPMHMRECVQQDYLGRFYEDFYRVVVQNERFGGDPLTPDNIVVVQNERYDDWTSTLIQLKRLMNDYPNKVLRCHERDGAFVPRACNSSASQGNFLEVLNMALNVFEKYFLDRCFDRTGKLSIVITPGPGVFEVDRELTNITKQRTIDCGNSSDLVCMGEQPLHAVPLFKFHNKNPSNTIDVGDDYNIPHWINHSFYTSKAQAERMSQGKFIPRIKTPQTLPFQHGMEMPQQTLSTKQNESQLSVTDEMPFIDYDEYDAQVFKVTTRHKSHQRKNLGSSNSLHNVKDMKKRRIPRVRYSGDIRKILLIVTQRDAGYQGESVPIDIPVKKVSLNEEYLSNSFGGYDKELTGKVVHASRLVGSAGSPVGHQGRYSATRQRQPRALINPFAPSRLHFKVTSNRRRWAHAFPTDPQGASVQPHHQHNVKFSFSESHPTPATSPPTREVIQAAQFAVELRRQRGSRRTSDSSDAPDTSRTKSFGTSSESGSVGSLKDLITRDGYSRETLTSTGSSSTYQGSGKAADMRKVSSSSTLNLSRADSYSSVSSVLTHTTTPAEQQRDGSGSAGGRHYLSMHQSALGIGNNYAALPSSDEPHNWLWGVTGEQEWTPEIQTGMDWKSMTIPASLPMTTDYFPDKRSLQIDYVISDYNLLPEDFNQDHQDRVNQKPLTTVEVFKEMIAQRLAQGFQIVILPKTSSPSAVTALSSSPAPFQPSLVARSRSNKDPMEFAPQEELILSIGRIFHKLSIVGHCINVTRYWPRHPTPQQSYHYTYRFQVPDSDNYDVSWTDFNNEKLENYNWNYVDQYICTRGEDDFGLSDSLKYWRARFFLLPCNNPSTKKIADGPVDCRCDIYEEKSIQEEHQLMDGFLRFVETANKIKRPGLTRMPKVSSAKDLAGRSVQSPVPLDKDAIAKAKSGSKVTEGTDTPPGCGSMVVSSPGIEMRKGLMSGVTESTSTSAAGTPTSTVKPQDTSVSSAEYLPQLCLNSSCQEMVELMLDPNDGLNFLKNQQGLPPLPTHCFVAAEATMWLIQVMDGLESVAQASRIMQKLLDEQWICHGSSNKRHKFVFGFYLYFITPEKDRKGPQQQTPLNYCTFYNLSFEYEWCEIAIHLNKACEHGRHVDNCILCSGVPFLNEQLPGRWQFDMQSSADMVTNIFSGSGLYKLVNVDIDPSHKSDREEWGTALYHANYNPNAAFELVVQWLVATGCILGELILSWARKASSCGFHFLPVPGDPFALPFTANSDPLRGPIFVPLDIECLKRPCEILFEDFHPETREQRLFLFQETILKRFGFMHDKCPMSRETSVRFSSLMQPQYVHCSGGMFAMIPDTKAISPRNKDGTHRGGRKSKPGSMTYISHNWPDSYSDKQEQHDSYYRVGFLWSWNFMLTKRWRSGYTGDENFQDKMLADFRAFCSNTDNRLRELWESSRSCQSEYEERQGELGAQQHVIFEKRQGELGAQQHVMFEKRQGELGAQQHVMFEKAVQKLLGEESPTTHADKPVVTESSTT